MIRYVRHAVAFVLAAAWLTACAGLTAIPADEAVVEGQVRIVSEALRPSDSSTIEVSVAGTSIATRVGPDGSFVLDGVPTGDVELVFGGPWGASSVLLEAIARGQTVRVAVIVEDGGAAIEAVSRSSDDLVLNVLPDRWQLAWLDAGGDDPVLGMITGDDTFLDRLDPDCFQLVGELENAEPLVPVEVLLGTRSVALKFAGAAALSLLDSPFAGSQHDVEVGFCYAADDDEVAASDTTQAETYFLEASVTVADDEVPEPGALFTAEFDPNVILLEPAAEATARLIVRGAQTDLETVGGQLRLAEEPSDANSPAAEPGELEDGGDDTPQVLEVWFDLKTTGEDAFLEATLDQAELAEFVGGEPGTYALTLTLTLTVDPGEEEDVGTTANASVDVTVTLRLADDEEGDEDPASDGLVAELQPAAWNTNWGLVGAGWVTVKIFGDGYADVILDTIELSASEAVSEDSESEDSDALEPERAQRQGNHVRAFFRQRDAIALLGEPSPGETYELWVHLGQNMALPVTVTVTGPPR